MSALGTCQAYTTRTITVARGAKRYRRCTQPATQTRVHVEPTVGGSFTRKVVLCPRHVGMFDGGQYGILESRA